MYFRHYSTWQGCASRCTAEGGWFRLTRLPVCCCCCWAMQPQSSSDSGNMAARIRCERLWFSCWFSSFMLIWWWPGLQLRKSSWFSSSVQWSACLISWLLLLMLSFFKRSEIIIIKSSGIYNSSRPDRYIFSNERNITVVLILYQSICTQNFVLYFLINHLYLNQKYLIEFRLI